MTGLVFTWLCCLLVGAVMDRALFPMAGRGLVESAGRALALGLGSAGALSMFVDSLGLGVSPVTVGASLALLTVMLLWLALRGKGPCREGETVRATASQAGPCASQDDSRASQAGPPASRPGPPAARPYPPAMRIVCAGALIAAALLLVFVVYTAWIRPTCQMDALVRWMFKTKALALEGTLLGPLSTDPAFHFTHQRYPPLVAHVAHLPSLFSGAFNDRIASAVYPGFALALVCMVYGALCRHAGRLQGCLGALWVASLPLIAFRDGPPPLGVPPGSGAFSALADIPLALFAFGAAMAALDGIEGRRKGAYLEAGLMLAFAALTKNEGLPLVAGVALGILLFARQRRWSAMAGVAALALLLYLVLWGRLALTFPALDEHYPGQFNFAALSEGLHRLPVILLTLLKETVFLPDWNLLWPALIALLVLSGRAALDRGGRLLLLICLLQLSAYVLAFTITAWTSPAALQAGGGDPVPYLMDLTLGRLLLHIAPIAIMAALRTAPLKIK